MGIYCVLFSTYKLSHHIVHFLSSDTHIAVGKVSYELVVRQIFPWGYTNETKEYANANVHQCLQEFTPYCMCMKNEM